MKDGLFTITSCEKDHGANEMSLHNRHQKPICIKRKLFQNHLNGKTFDANEAVKNELIQFFAFKNQTFYESGIMRV